MLIKFPQRIGSVPDAGVTDPGKSNVYGYTYPGRKIERQEVEEAVSNSEIVQSAREAQFVSTHTSYKNPESGYEDLSNEKRQRNNRHTTSWHGVGLKSRGGSAGKGHFGGIGSVRTIGS